MKVKLVTPILFLFLVFFYFSSVDVNAQNSVTVKAGVGKYYFTVSGIVSPYATVVMTTQNIFMSSTVADDQGRFVLPRSLVNEGFTSYCLEATDIKRIGTSYTCFTTEPAMADFSEQGLFLAPTLGLSGRKLTPDSSIIASGYTMPESEVDINLAQDFFIETEADSEGYYEATIEDIPSGKYELYSKANYDYKTSLKPTKTVEIESVSRLSGMLKVVLIIIFVLIVLAILILLFILVKRRRSRKVSKPRGKLRFRFRFKKS